MRAAQGKCLSDGLDTEGVTEPTVFHEVQDPPDGCHLEVDAIGIISETNPPGIDSAEDPEAGSNNGPRPGTIPNPTNEGWTLAPQSRLEQEAGPVLHNFRRLMTRSLQEQLGHALSVSPCVPLTRCLTCPLIPADNPIGTMYRNPFMQACTLMEEYLPCGQPVGSMLNLSRRSRP